MHASLVGGHTCSYRGPRQALLGGAVLRSSSQPRPTSPKQAASLPTALAVASALPASPLPPQDGKIDFKEFCDLIRKYPCD